MGGSSLLNNCSAIIKRAEAVPLQYERLATRVRNVSFPSLIEQNILEDTDEVPFYTYYLNNQGVFEEKTDLLDLRAATIAYSGILTEYNTYNYTLSNIPEILSKPKRDPSEFKVEH